MTYDEKTERIIQQEVTKLSYSKVINDAIEEQVRKNVETWIAGRTEEATLKTKQMDKELKDQIDEKVELKNELDRTITKLENEIRVKKAEAKAIDLYKLSPGNISSAILSALTELKELRALVPVMKEKTAALKQISKLSKGTV